MIHIVGVLVRVGSLVRQRCSWCGELLHEADVRLVAVHPAPEDPAELERALEGGWTTGRLLRVEGSNPRTIDTVDHVDGEGLPPGWCGDPPIPKLTLVKNVDGDAVLIALAQKAAGFRPDPGEALPDGDGVHWTHDGFSLMVSSRKPGVWLVQLAASGNLIEEECASLIDVFGRYGEDAGLVKL